MTNWTKGPWALELTPQTDWFDDETPEWGIRSVEAEYPHIEYRPYYPSVSDNMADNHLIAAAPELYEALVAILNFIENTESEMGITLQSGDKARAALSKARGEQ